MKGRPDHFSNPYNDNLDGIENIPEKCIFWNEIAISFNSKDEYMEGEHTQIF